MTANPETIQPPQVTISSTPTSAFNKETMIKEADHYHSIGIPIVPFTKTWNDKKQRWDKKPVIDSWKQWQTRSQTDEEYRDLHLENYTLFGVLCGTPFIINGETVYLTIVDRDVKDPDIPQTVKDQTLKAINLMPTTQRERSINNGLHLIYGSRIQTDNPKPSKIGMELLSLGTLAVMAPSEDYYRENDNPITIITDAEDAFYKALEETGLYKKPVFPSTTKTLQTSTMPVQATPRPCITEALKQQLTEGNGHRMRFTTAAEYKRLGYPTSQIVELFRGQKDFDYSFCQTQVESADPARVAKCETIHSWGYCLGPEKCQWRQHTQPPKTELINEATNTKLEALAIDPNIEQRFLEDIHRKVKNDDLAVIDTFHTGLSTYLKPNNLIHKSPSGAGKTYSTTETIDYFPQEDVITIGTQSPKVLSHQQGELMTIDPNGKEIPFSYDEAPEKPRSQDYKGKPEEYKAALEDYKQQHREYEQKIKNHFTLIRLSGKAMVFLDTISRETFEMYKTTLSHDKPKISHEYVDDKGSVHRTVLEGWPSATFCTADPKILSQEFLTRTFSDYLATDSGKIAAAQEVIDNTTSDPWEYEGETEEKQLIKRYIREVRDTIKRFNIKSVQPFPSLRNIIGFSNTAVRDMRDYGHFSQLLPTYTLFKLFQRPIITVNGENRLVATIEDVLAALKQFRKIEETTRSGTEKTILDFYYEAVAIINPETGATVDEIRQKSKIKSSQTIRDRLKTLEQAGYVNIEDGLQKDKRRWTVFPIKGKVVETTTDSQSDVDLQLKLQKDAEAWLETSSLKYSSIQAQKIDFVTKQLVPISIEEFKRLIGIDSNSKLLVFEGENSLIPIENTKSTSDSQTVVDSPTSETIHYQQLNPYIETHPCDKCKATQAEYKTEQYYLCPSCFNDAKATCESQGAEFVEDQAELPPYPKEPPIPA